MYGLPTVYGAPVKAAVVVHYNDWQDLLLFGVGNVVNGLTDYNNAAGVSVRPSTIPGWSTTAPFHIAFVWDGAAPELDDRAQIYVNGNRVGTTSHGGNPTFTGWPDDYRLWLGSRLHSGDWNRHHWEGLSGVADNIKVWSYAKTDFSDRFKE